MNQMLQMMVDVLNSCTSVEGINVIFILNETNGIGYIGANEVKRINCKIDSLVLEDSYIDVYLHDGRIIQTYVVCDAKSSLLTGKKCYAVRVRITPTAF